MEDVGTLRWRVERVEKRVEQIDHDGTRGMLKLEAQVENLNKEVSELGKEVTSLRRALYTTALSVASGAIVFAVTILQVVHH